MFGPNAPILVELPQSPGPFVLQLFLVRNQLLILKQQIVFLLLSHSLRFVVFLFFPLHFFFQFFHLLQQTLNFSCLGFWFAHLTCVAEFWVLDFLRQLFVFLELCFHTIHTVHYLHRLVLFLKPYFAQT